MQVEGYSSTIGILFVVYHVNTAVLTVAQAPPGVPTLHRHGRQLHYDMIQADYSSPASAQGAIVPSRDLRGLAIWVRHVVRPPEGVRRPDHTALPTAPTMDRLSEKTTNRPTDFIPSCS